MLDRIAPDIGKEANLVAAFLLGQPKAVRPLFDYLAPLIVEVCQQRLRRFPSADPEEAQQVVLERLFVNNAEVLRRWRQEKPLLHYVAVIAANHCNDLIESIRRTERRHDRETDVEEIFGTAPSPESHVMGADYARCIRTALDRLSATYRAVIRLRYLEDLKHQEIADRLNMAIGSVGTTLKRAESYLSDEVRLTCGDHLGRIAEAFTSVARRR